MDVRTTVGAACLVFAAALAACFPNDPRRDPRPAAAAAKSSATLIAGDAGQRPLAARLYDDAALFQRKIAPRPGDWLARFREPGQTFAEYEVSRPNRASGARSKLVLQPLGAFRTEEAALVAKLREHMEIFFGLAVATRAPLPLPAAHKRTRREGARTWEQYRTGTIMDDVLKKRLPADAVVYLGITTADLYPGDEWNFVFGEARFEERVGVYSVGRMFERFEGRPETDESRVRGLARSAAILAHETGHAFGIAHCTRFECVMNGTNSLEELDRQFAEPCPVCLHKLVWNIGLDPVVRYEKLRDFYRREHVESLATWIDARLARLGP